MRISTNMAYRTAMSSMQSSLNGIRSTQQQLSTGEKFQTASEDPTDAAQVLNLDAQLANLGARGKSLDVARLGLQSEAQSLTDAQGILSQARTLAIQANSGANDATAREAIAQQIDSLRTQLISVANRNGADGKPLFGGNKTTNPPFSVDGAGNVTYQGGDQPTWLQVDTAAAMPSGDTGRSVFMTQANGQDVFTTLQDLAAAIRNPDPAQRSTDIGAAESTIDAQNAHLTLIATQNGGRLNALTVLENAQGTQKVSLQDIRSQAGDADYAQAASQLTMLSTALQAAQQSFAKIQTLSLFQWLR